MITHVHPSSADRKEARKFGLCWHPTELMASWSCFKGPEETDFEPYEPAPSIPVQQTAPEAPAAPPADAARVVQVTFREYDVANELVKTGGSNAEIGKALYLSEDTVKSHMKKLLLRTGQKTRAELIVAHYRGRIRLAARPMVGH